MDIAEAPELKSKPKRSQIAATVALVTGFGLLVFVFVRNGFRKAEEDPGTKIRIKNIRVVLRRQFWW